MKHIVVYGLLIPFVLIIIGGIFSCHSSDQNISAIDWLKKAYKTQNADEKKYGYYQGLALTYEELGKLYKEERSNDKAINAFNSAGNIQFYIKNYFDAARLFHRAYDVQPDNAKIKAYLAKIYKQLGDIAFQKKKYLEAGYAYTYTLTFPLKEEVKKEIQGNLTVVENNLTDDQKNLVVTTISSQKDIYTLLKNVSVPYFQELETDAVVTGTSMFIIVLSIVAVFAIIIILVITRGPKTSGEKNSFNSVSSRKDQFLKQKDWEQLFRKIVREELSRFQGELPKVHFPHVDQEEIKNTARQSAVDELSKTELYVTYPEEVLETIRNVDSAYQNLFEKLSQIEKQVLILHQEYRRQKIGEHKTAPEKPVRANTVDYVEFKEEDLIQWWIEYGVKDFSTVFTSLKEKFGDEILVENIQEIASNINDEWDIVAIKPDPFSDYYYALPRRNSLYNNFMKEHFLCDNPTPSRIAKIKMLREPAQIEKLGGKMIKQGFVELKE